MNALPVLAMAGALLLFGLSEGSARAERGDEAGTRAVPIKGASRQKPTGVTYRVVGVMQRDKVFIGGSTIADVTEQVEFTFTWPLEEGVRPKVLPNIPTKLVDPRDGAAVCPAPILKGAYEHFDLKSITVIGAMFALVGERRTPDLDEYVPASRCKGTRPVQGQVREEQVLVTLPPEFLAGQLSKGQVFTQQDQGWTWTFTPLP